MGRPPSPFGTMIKYEPKALHVIGGKPTDRPDAIDKVTGRARYAADINLPGQRFGKVLRSPHAHARFRFTDLDAARAMPGVHLVITAEDVAFSFDLALNPAKNMTAVYGAPLQSAAGADEVMAGTADHISGVNVIDDNTISITFKQPNALFPDSISELFILPKHKLEGMDLATMKENPYWADAQVGTGPFVWSKYTPGESIELKANPSYFKGAPKIGTLIRRNFADPAAALLAAADLGQLGLAHAVDDDRDVTRALADAGRTTARTRPPALGGRALVGPAGGDVCPRGGADARPGTAGDVPARPRRIHGDRRP